MDISSTDRQKIIDSIFTQKKDYSDILRLEALANPLRLETKEKLISNGFKPEMFYVQKGHPLRLQTLFYDFAFGYESKLAGTGVYEYYFQSAFEHPDFEKVINYIFPEMIGKEPWNFQNENTLKEFCNGIFRCHKSHIRGYSEAIPIRLATYFYPDNLLPIFKLDELKQNCKAFGFETDVKTKGDKLFYFNSFLADEMKSLPFINIVKQNISYQVRYTIELLNRLGTEKYSAVIADCNKDWIKNFYKDGQDTLGRLRMI